jgi:hypothetical protein
VNYSSVMLLGTPDEVEGSAKKLTHMKVFVDRLFPGRWDELRAVSSKELKATKVMGMEIDEASAKIRTGPPADDEQDYELPIWAGVLPLRTVIGAPEPCPRLQQGIARPGYLQARLTHVGRCSCTCHLLCAADARSVESVAISPLAPVPRARGGGSVRLLRPRPRLMGIPKRRPIPW